MVAWDEERRREPMPHASRGTLCVLAACAACSDRGSGTRAELADYCDRVCNCANDATDQCMNECADEHAASDISQDCVGCVQTTGCGEIQTGCAEACGSGTRPFPDAGIPDVSVPGCPAGRMELRAFLLARAALACSEVIARCDYAGDYVSCVDDEAHLPFEDTPGLRLQCDDAAVLACLENIRLAPCDAFEDDFGLTVDVPGCREAGDTCCDVDPKPTPTEARAGSSKPEERPI